MLGMLLLTDARRPARVSSAGELIPLGEPVGCGSDIRRTRARP
ncbi:hypothetical protein [Cryobacterium sp. 10C3]|nr:hypothetical protein [Cryobacterium sp. 10C3]MDY7555275.1 hypothetical protein [Cryobacterium sp. 10C3]